MKRPRWLCELGAVCLMQLVLIGASIAAPVSNEDRTFSTGAAPGILSEIIADVQRRWESERDPVQRAFLSQLAGHYREPDAQPHWIDDDQLNAAAVALEEKLTAADRYGLDPEDFKLRPLEGTRLAIAEVDRSIAAIRYAWHARGGRFNPSQMTRWIETEAPTLYVSEVFRAIAESGGDPIAGLRKFHPHHPQFELFRQAYLRERSWISATSGGAGPKRDRAKAQTILVNLERWRTMPARLADFHVWNNLPEFITRLVDAGQVVHSERIIIGKPSTQTPIFSDVMTHLIFNPEWGVPESIKIQSLLPSLRRGDTGILARRNMSIRDGQRVLDPKTFRWSKVDIRSVPIVQGSGPTNPLGQIKFMFPNHHDVYMHDTPDKALFNKPERAFSAGCIRVRNPEIFAHKIVERLQDWSIERTQSLFESKTTTRVDLLAPIPVHNTYFTAWVDSSGEVRIWRDIYGHDARYKDALAGKPMARIASRDPALALKMRNDEMRRTAGYPPASPKPSSSPQFTLFDFLGLTSTAPAQVKNGPSTKTKKPKTNQNPPSAFWF